ncbi:STN domain-containing protein [Pseudomonas sp. B329]|uniref:STN domain-containing protein n=1 Tax=Pseudomonas sp. B329 TaxID=1553459 RepID=UPI002002F9D6|nr:STN domain-containing protein [Pseudomonas sp. B329]MCK3865562.1 hypothetical protein [Pseudomonas sp. B329]
MISATNVLRTSTMGLLLLSLQPLHSTAIFAQTERQTYNIEAGPLDLSLTRFGVQAHINMAGRSTLTANKRSNGLHGDFSTEAGLARLLEGTGLSFHRHADGSYELQSATSATAQPSQEFISDDYEESASGLGF